MHFAVVAADLVVDRVVGAFGVVAGVVEGAVGVVEGPTRVVEVAEAALLTLPEVTVTVFGYFLLQKS